MSNQRLIIIPTYNEELNIEPLVKAIFVNAPQVSLLFVDDNSKDKTRAKIQEMSQLYPQKINIIERPRKLGLGSAYIDGFKWGLSRKFSVILEMDADLSHNSSYLNKIFTLLKSHDLVIGSRYVKGGGTENWSLIRRLISRAGSSYARLILGVRVEDFTGGFNAWHARVLEKINLDDIRSDGYVFQIELKYRAIMAGFSFTETPIIFADRTLGQSKMSLDIVLEAVYKVFLLRAFKNKFKALGQNNTK
ncbi:MAG: polyprenol monophosphomannose synthase [Oligoflexales bacterium]|nr:polyprenol monophosphomannose synthase [Oligoflexales bacterium]